MIPDPLKRCFWAKLNQQAQPLQWLSLVDHSLDVAAVFRHLLELNAIRASFEQAAAQSLSPAQCDRLAVLAGFHDMGKANLGFQNKPFQNIRAGHILETRPLWEEFRTEFIQSLHLDQLSTWFEQPEYLEDYLIAVLSHHGRPIAHDLMQYSGRYRARSWWYSDGQRDPWQALSQIYQQLAAYFPKAFEAQTAALPIKTGLVHRFAGLLMLADWIASDERFFPLTALDQNRHLQRDQAAQTALKTIGLNSSSWQDQPLPDFNACFGFYANELQAHFDQLDPETDRLVIAESSTGSGKTEAALHWFFRLFAAKKVDGLYFALPTRVAAREIYQRIKAIIAQRFNQNPPPVVLAVPAYAQAAKPILPEPDGRIWSVNEMHWAAEHPKRFLAATIAVGTIDQALLSFITVPHAHMRSICLDRQLLVVDEVHASDEYMNYLLADLLNHHCQSSYALLLSATLGSRAKAKFLNQKIDLETAKRLPYPLISHSQGQIHFSAQQSKTVYLKTYADDADLFQLVKEALQQGAKVLWICNTVNRALSVQQQCENRLPAAQLFQYRNILCPHHGRFALEDRQGLDQQVSHCFGKGSKNQPLLLIGTQTLEQSLDIDADLLITDLCPIDVLLQRIGRLHRHQKPRSAAFKTAQCYIRVPDRSLADYLDDQGQVHADARAWGWGSVYANLAILQLTWKYLDEGLWHLPQDNRRLIESCIHEQAWQTLNSEAWQAHLQQVDGLDLAKNIRAHHISLKPLLEKPFSQCHFTRLSEHAKTRLGLLDLRLELPKAITSPFSHMIKTLSIPAHLAPEDPVLEINVQHWDQRGFRFTIAQQSYIYNRFGLQRINAI